jgi:hypothetical protein
MCYSVYISTDSPEDLTAMNSELVRFERIDAGHPDPVVTLLEHPQKYYVGSKSVCSCTFRHLLSIELGFGAPVDWYREDHDDLVATAELYRIFSTLLSSGHRLDCIDAWEGAGPEDIETLDVSLEEVSEADFRLFEDYRFRLSKSLR